MKQENIYKIAPIFISVFVFCFAVAFYALGWTEPTIAPPGGNVDVPINVGSFGQSKAGGLILNTGGAANGLIVQNGNVGIGTTTPSTKLDVAGAIHTTGDVCTDAGGGKCLSSPSFSLGTKDCYVTQPDRWTNAVCKQGFYVKAIYKSTDGNWDGFGPMCCRADSSIDDPALPTAQVLDAACPWGWPYINCTIQATTFPAGNSGF